MVNIKRSIYRPFKYAFYKEPLGEAAGNECIKEALLGDKPVMIARFGSTELKAVLYPTFPFFVRPIVRKMTFNYMQTFSGFYPSNEENIRKFSTMMLDDYKSVDILGSWRVEESLLPKKGIIAKRIRLRVMEPYFHSDPWSQALKDRKVLVIHPFNKTIEYQYQNNRELLFGNKGVLPEFKSLETIKAVQSIAGNQTEFSDWFEALDYMKREIDKKDFDVAIIGCGAYGFPLAAHVKRIGKKALHLGGATQILFGVKGKRWMEHPDFKGIINEHFVYPSDEDTPKHFTKVENGCYWK